MIPYRRGAAALFAVCLLGLAGPAAAGPANATPASAATKKPGPTAPAFSLSVSPTRFAMSAADIGQSKIFTVSNHGSLAIDVVVQLSGFTSSRAGAMVLQSRAAWSAVNWVSVKPGRFHLTSGQREKVTVRVTVPTGPEPGDHQVALVFLVPAAKNGPNIRLGRGIGAPVYITVPGPRTTATHVSSLQAAGFALHGPIRFRATVVDTGTVHQDFRGKSALSVRADGGSVSFPDFTVLRDSTRDVSVRWNPPFACICHATVRMADASGVSEKTVRIVVLPLDLLAYALGGLLVLGAGALVLRHRRRPTG